MEFSKIVQSELKKCRNVDILNFKLKEEGISLAPPQYNQFLKTHNKSKLIWWLSVIIEINIETYCILKKLKNGHSKNVLRLIYEFKILHFLVGFEKLEQESIKYYNYLLDSCIENASFLD